MVGPGNNGSKESIKADAEWHRTHPSLPPEPETRPEFVYVHDWTGGDLLVWDNRCLVHTATWFDTATHTRLMWRTTVSGNPGAAYAGEAKSWIAA